MDKVSDSSNKWAEDIYWSHFQFTHFYQILAGGSEQKLVLPNKFVNNLKKKLPSTVTLKGPSGATWDVGLSANDDKLYFKHGWQEFVKAHSLEQNDLLVFRYNGASQFDVLVFDWKSFCEKEASYFVKICEHTNSDTGHKAKRKFGEPTLDSFDVDANNGAECASSENNLHDDSMERMIQDVVSKATNLNGQPEVFSAQPIRTIRTRRRKETPKSAAVMTPTPAPVQLSDSDEEATPVKKIGSYAEQYLSNRRAITEEDKNNALKLAEAASSNAGFKVIMRPSHVYRRFYLFIPTQWVTKNLSLCNQDVILRLGNNEWPAKFSFTASRQCGGLTSGWKHFAIDNNLEEFDVCVFEPVPKTSGPVVLEVRIFRVVEDVIPLTRVSAKSNRKLIKAN
ncbi:B3 domain-containing protein REM16-like [Cucurbita pepo subsp. pepo]|uniref:B3 domain-containing protein REM16-like n=1 Tax=Cucurbita pepo subsp. pepo TaxID=3664 RepID=UPI000C9D598A|nr:B3 domain-containing protein REM16-like [Cucurbita pepo subsp. pepo]